jgi:hypothetical protein
MGFSFAHGAQKKGIMVALWGLPPFELDQMPRNSKVGTAKDICLD